MLHDSSEDLMMLEVFSGKGQIAAAYRKDLTEALKVQSCTRVYLSHIRWLRGTIVGH